MNTSKTRTIRTFSLTEIELDRLNELKIKTGFSHSLLIRLAIELLDKNFKKRKNILIV